MQIFIGLIHDKLPYDFMLDDSLAMNSQMKLSQVKSVIVRARISKTGNVMTQAGDFGVSVGHWAYAPGLECNQESAGLSTGIARSENQRISKVKRRDRPLVLDFSEP